MPNTAEHTIFKCIKFERIRVEMEREVGQEIGPDNIVGIALEAEAMEGDNGERSKDRPREGTIHEGQMASRTLNRYAEGGPRPNSSMTEGKNNFFIT